jgi:hypothetical protein
MPANQDSKRFSAVDPSRRVFIMKYTALAFATPLIASFALDGVASAAPRPGLGQQHRFPNQHCPNQHLPNQHKPDQCCPNQHFPNQHLPNQQLPNQHCPNQHFPNQHFPNQHLPNQCGPGWRPWHEQGFEGGKQP